MSLELVPTTLEEAKLFVEHHHRHHRPPLSGLFAVACASEGDVVGVAIVGRPVARELQDGFTAEVTRVCTIDAPESRHAASKLYAACWRASRALGYRRLITYTLSSENGASLRGAGWRVVGELKGRSWDMPGRPRVDWHPTLVTEQGRVRWEAL